MVEGEMTTLVERFGDMDIELIPDNQHGFLIVTAVVARGYGVAPSTIRDHKQKHADELVEGKHWVDGITVTPGGRQKATFWTKRGVLRLGNWITTDTGKRFRDWTEDLGIERLEGRLVPLGQARSLEVSQLLELSRNLLVSQGVMVEKVDLLQGEVKDVREQAEVAHHRAVLAEQEATQALDQITRLKQQFMDEAERSRLKKTVKDKMHELAVLFIELGEPREVAYSRVWTVMRNRYSFSKFADMHWLYYKPAIKFLQETIDRVKQNQQVPVLFLKKNHHLIKPEPLPMGMEE